MFGSLQLGRVFGIPIRLHGLLLVLLLVVAAMSSNPLATLIWMSLLITVVGLHELGHCLVARRFGATVLDITFWPLGGMARMSDLPEDTRAEVAIALAGPAVNFVLALGSLVVLTALAPFAGTSVGALLSAGLPGALAPTLSPDVAPLLGVSLALALWFLVINLMLGLFNLVPAFPMDGGRVLRATLGRTRDWVTATEQAVRVSRWIAVAMVIIGFTRPNMLLLPLIAVFVWISGARELWSVRLRHGKFPFGKTPAGWSGFVDLSNQAGARAPGGGPLRGPFSGLGGAPFGPPVDRDPARPSAPGGGLDPEPSAARSDQTSSAGDPAPAWTVEARPRSGGFSDEQLAELERMRGRLPRSS